MSQQTRRGTGAPTPSRRHFIRLAALAGAGSLLAACTPAPAAAPPPTTVPPAATAPPAPAAATSAAAPAATAAAPAPTAAPAAAAAPTAAPKPAAPTAAATAGAVRRITFTYGSLSPSIWPLRAAAEKGFWQKYGLEVELVRTENATTSVQALLGGSAQVTAASGSTFMGPVAEGARLKVLATLSPKSLDSLLARPGTTSAAQLKGGKIAVGSIGDLSHMTAYLMLQSLGVNPETDVTYLQIGNDGARAAALQSGAVDGAPLNATASEKLVKEFGFPVLIRGEEQGIAFPAFCFATSQATFDRDPAMLQAFLRGVLDGIDWVNNSANEQEARAMLARELKVAVDDPAIEVGYRTYIVNKLYAVPPLVNREAFERVQRFSAKFNPKLQEVDLGTLLDTSLLTAAAQRG